MATRTRSHRDRRTGALTLDEALIALFIEAMNANEHVAADEAARAQHLISSTRRFRRKSGATLGKLIQDMRQVVDELDSTTVVARAAKAIPARFRAPAFAVVADLLLADGKLEGPERRFLERMRSALALDRDTARGIVDVVLMKNQL